MIPAGFLQQKIQIECQLHAFFQQGYKTADRFFRIFGGGTQKGVVQLDGEYDEHDSGECTRILEMDIIQSNALWAELLHKNSHVLLYL